MVTAMPAEFTHLHLHTLYSLLDGAIRLPDLMESCARTGMKSVAVTDHGNMFGVVNFYQEAKNDVGYRNLRYLSSKAFTDGFYYDPRVDKPLLKAHCEGLLALTACMAGA